MIYCQTIIEDDVVKCPICNWERPAALFHGKPVVRRCPAAKSRGLGDTIAKMTHGLGIKKCGNCAKRQAALNRLFPY